MNRRLVIALMYMACTGATKAQIAESALHVSWTTMKPAYTDFVGKTSSRGVRVGFSKFLSENWGWGLEGGYSVFDDYVPRQTYEYPGGAVTTDIYNYMYYYTLALNGQYYYKPSEVLVPYAALMAGVAFTEYAMFYNVYSDADSNTSFLLRPEIGLMYRFGKYSGMGFKAAIGYDYAMNKNEYFGVDNFSAFNVQVGLVLFNR
jgi:hypothetical protein